MKRNCRMSKLSLSNSKAVESGVSLIVVLGWLAAGTGCTRTFVTNNYLTPSEDAGQQENDETTVAIEAGSTDAAVDADATALTRVDAGDDASIIRDAATVADARVGAEDASDAHVEPLAEGVPLVNASISEQQLDVFGTFTNQYWFIATPEQVEAINNEFRGGGGGYFGGYGGDIYSPSSGQDTVNAVEHFVVTTPDGTTADFGRMKVKLVGQSTGRNWTESTLPNFKLDSDDVTSGVRIGGYEHFRLNNAVIGTIFREKFVYDFYRDLGYPAPLSTYAFVSSTPWGPTAKVPYIATESYKRGFCTNPERPDYFEGECPNMWEFANDFGYGVFEYPENCQFDECDATRASLFEAAVVDARNGGETTIAQLGEYVDWERFHEFQCLAWIFGTTDSPPIGANNTVWVERADGKFQLLPYSIDISLSLGSQGQWYDVGLYGNTVLAHVCQQDEQCWADTITTCEGVIDKFVVADPVARIDKLHADLETAGMLRGGDEARYNDLRGVLSAMVSELPTALDKYREVRGSVCYYYGQVDCGGYCTWPENCYLCDDAYYENPGNYPQPMGSAVPVPVPSFAELATPTPDAGAEQIVVVPDPSGDVAPPPVADAGVEPPGKPDFCYRNDYVEVQKEQEAYLLP
jgi:hypothetical protein